MHALFILIGQLIPHALAAPPPVVCTGLPGCGGGSPGQDIIAKAAAVVLQFLFTLVGAGSVAMVVWGGFEMVLSAGDEGRATKGKESIIHALIGLAIATCAGSIVTTAADKLSAGSFDPAGILATIVQIMLNIFNACVAIVVIIGAIRMAMAGGKSDQFQKGVSAIKWALIGAMCANAAKAAAELIFSMTS